MIFPILMYTVSNVFNKGIYFSNSLEARSSAPSSLPEIRVSTAGPRSLCGPPGWERILSLPLQLLVGSTLAACYLWHHSTFAFTCADLPPPISHLQEPYDGVWIPLRKFRKTPLSTSLTSSHSQSPFLPHKVTHTGFSKQGLAPWGDHGQPTTQPRKIAARALWEKAWELLRNAAGT